MLQFSLVFMLQERGPRQKTCLMTDIITFGVGNGAILSQDGKMKILRHVACFYSKCLAKMKNERPAWQCFLTISEESHSPSAYIHTFKLVLLLTTSWNSINRWTMWQEWYLNSLQCQNTWETLYLLRKGKTLILSIIYCPHFDFCSDVGHFCSQTTCDVKS